ncbi:hypothetical protein Enr8_16260 [Blastopirellula retiformator]|uniref:Uncharacterized protein n=1 Tax=Blastopirellula retiformator TaxID=2527970 RepID=A0A5C5V947_9BACT|nr:hypothetical protein Enr8_16260 [Blastopirellula retiformator]
MAAIHQRLEEKTQRSSPPSIWTLTKRRAMDRSTGEKNDRVESTSPRKKTKRSGPVTRKRRNPRARFHLDRPLGAWQFVVDRYPGLRRLMATTPLGYFSAAPSGLKKKMNRSSPVSDSIVARVRKPRECGRHAPPPRRKNETPQSSPRSAAKNLKRPVRSSLPPRGSGRIGGAPLLPLGATHIQTNHAADDQQDAGQLERREGFAEEAYADHRDQGGADA